MGYNDYELKFTYLWQIIELINTKAASKGKLCSTIPVYWLYNRFKTSSSDLNIEFEKIKTDFDSLYVMRSRGIVHRSMASWEPYSLRLYVQKLETYVNIFISNLFNLLLTDSTLISKDIESIMHKMMMDLVNRKLNQSYVDRTQQREDPRGKHPKKFWHGQSRRIPEGPQVDENGGEVFTASRHIYRYARRLSRRWRGGARPK